MTTTLYVASTEAFSGKSALCVGLLHRFQQDGFRIGYMKPVSTTARFVRGRIIDEDAHFLKYTLGLSDNLGQMAPILLNDQQVSSILTENGEDPAAELQAAYNTIASDKDMVVLEGGSNLREGWIINLTPAQVADLLNAFKLIVVPYNNDLQVVDDLLTAQQRLGQSFLGGVINQVPPDRLDFVRDKIKPWVESQGVPILACLPQERALLSASIAELSDQLGGEVLCSHHMVDKLVEHLLVGAMDTSLALTYFFQTPNKAVITSGDRVDLQMSALETSTHCLILTENLHPQPLIVQRAQEMEVPIILTSHDTLTAIEIVENLFDKSRFHRTEKVQCFEALLAEHFNFDALYRALGKR